jgi:hypothetical protein
MSPLHLLSSEASRTGGPGRNLFLGLLCKRNRAPSFRILRQRLAQRALCRQPASIAGLLKSGSWPIQKQ